MDFENMIYLLKTDPVEVVHQRGIVNNLRRVSDIDLGIYFDTLISRIVKFRYSKKTKVQIFQLMALKTIRDEIIYSELRGRLGIEQYFY